MPILISAQDDPDISSLFTKGAIKLRHLVVRKSTIQPVEENAKVEDKSEDRSQLEIPECISHL